MSTEDKIANIDIPSLTLVHYPDPRLREVCSPVPIVDENVGKLVDRMFEVMFSSRGVGLAAPQVGVPVRIFIASPTFEPDDRRVYINPEIIDLQGKQDGEEGCLSFPGIFCKVKRAMQATIRAQNVDGEWFEETGEDLLARIFQHESDHLEGRLLADRMSKVARIANRRALNNLEEEYQSSR
ncbi:MAG: peptide deformylase [Phycisphaerae bacterium]